MGGGVSCMCGILEIIVDELFVVDDVDGGVIKYQGGRFAIYDA